jgi:hypothetical protein
VDCNCKKQEERLAKWHEDKEKASRAVTEEEHRYAVAAVATMHKIKECRRRAREKLGTPASGGSGQSSCSTSSLSGSSASSSASMD